MRHPSCSVSSVGDRCFSGRDDDNPLCGHLNMYVLADLEARLLQPVAGEAQKGDGARPDPLAVTVLIGELIADLEAAEFRA